MLRYAKIFQVIYLLFLEIDCLLNVSAAWMSKYLITFKKDNFQYSIYKYILPIK